MTSPAERIREANRGWRMAEPASRSRIAALDTFGLRYVQVDDFNVIVEGDYQLNLAMSFWRSNDGSSQGYLVSTLDAEIRRGRAPARKPSAIADEVVSILRTKSKKPAPGRDSTDKPELTASSTSVAESGAGRVSSSLLPVVAP